MESLKDWNKRALMKTTGQVWWLTPIIPDQKAKREDCRESKASQDYRMILFLKNQEDKPKMIRLC